MTKKSATSPVARDIMKTDLVVINPRDTLQDALSLMTENHVTGLPVVDGRSRCVGLITATDILTYEQEHSEFTSEVNAEMAQHFDMDTQRWESVRVSSFALEEFGDIPVEDVMARELVFVDRDAPLVEVAKKMVNESIHRVLVLDEERRLYGIISAFDFVRLYAESP